VEDYMAKTTEDPGVSFYALRSKDGDMYDGEVGEDNLRTLSRIRDFLN
jgi:hypothetical protein